MTVFISYNHKDQPLALKIRDRLQAAGLDTLIDIDNMAAGQGIEQFIYDSLKNSHSTLFLISSNSLMSAWVTMETVAGRLDELLGRRYFIPCSLDTAFLDRNFTGRALEHIESELEEINQLIEKSIKKDWGIEDLQGERTRYNNLKNQLPNIIGTLRNSGCVDLSPENFEAGINKVVNDLKTRNPEIPAEGLMESKPMATVPSLREKIVSTLDDYTKERLNDITRRLSMQRELLDKYEQDLLMEIDPRRQMYCEREIQRLKKSIQASIEEINET